MNYANAKEVEHTINSMGLMLLAVAAYMFFAQKGNSDNNNKKTPFSNISESGLFGENTKGLLESLSRLNQDGQGINMSAILELLSNPLVFELLKNFFLKGGGGATAAGAGMGAAAGNASEAGAKAAQEDVFTAGKGQNDSSSTYNGVDEATGEAFFERSGAAQNAGNKSATAADSELLPYSAESREFFKPVERVAGPISDELYSYYDNWYINK